MKTRVLFVGVAGGLKEEYPHGTVVVADRVYLYESGKDDEDFLQRPVSFRTLYSLSQLVRVVRRTAWSEEAHLPEVVLGPIAAGDKVVAATDSITYRLLRERFNDAVAVDMESVGLYDAAHRAEVPALVVRGISDMIKDKSADRDKEWQPVAARNAAAFAIALLRAVDSDDLRITTESTVPPREWDDLLSRVPAPVAAALQRVQTHSQETAMDLLRRMTDEAHPPSDAAREFVFGGDEVPLDRNADSWVAIAEYAAAHGLHAAASTAFLKAAQVEPGPSARWMARAALASAASSDIATAHELVGRARREADATEAPFVDLIDSAIEEDAARVLKAAEEYSGDDSLVEIMRIHALALLERTDEALDAAFEVVSAHPGRSLTAGSALMAARVFVQRTEQARVGPSRLADLEAARELALKARDERRRWRGPSGEAALVAAQAAAAARDLEGVLRIALPSPDGEATDAEAQLPELRVVAANASLALGQVEKARSLVPGIGDAAERLLVEAACERLEGNDEQAVKLYEAALEKADRPDQQFRALAELAGLGRFGEEQLEDLATEDAEGAELVRATYDLWRGQDQEAFRRLRTYKTLRSLAFTVSAHVDSDRMEKALELLSDGAIRFDRPELNLWAVQLLTSRGQYSNALDHASGILAVTPAGTHLHDELHPGRDAERLLSSLGINRFENFPVTKAKHYIPTSYTAMCLQSRSQGFKSPRLHS